MVRGIAFGEIKSLRAVCSEGLSDWASVVFSNWLQAFSSKLVGLRGPRRTNDTEWYNFFTTISMGTDAASALEASTSAESRSQCVIGMKLHPWGFRNAIEDPCQGRRLFMFDDGTIGLAPPEAEMGDVVCIFLDGPVPFFSPKARLSVNSGWRMLPR